MNKRYYLHALSAALSNRVSAQDRKDILHYYEDYFDQAGPAGVAAVVEELGDPFVLAARLAAEGGFDAEKGPGEPPTVLRRATRAAGVIVCGVVAVCVLLAVLLCSERVRNAMGLDPVIPWSTVEAGGERLDEVFRSVRVEVAAGDVELRNGNSCSVSLNWNRERNYSMSAEIRDGVLWVTSDTAPGPALNAGELNAGVVVTMPWENALERAEVETARGNIKINGIQAEELDLNAARGDVTVGSCLIGGVLRAESSTGDVKLRGGLAADTVLKTGTGDVEVSTPDAEEDCAYVLECGLGTLTIGGERRDSKLEKREGAVSLTCASGVGSVSVTFAAE